MKSFWDLPHIRTLETLATWSDMAPELAVGHLTLAQHMADEAELVEFLHAQFQHETDLQHARATRNRNLATLKELCVRGCQAVSGALEASDALLADVRVVTSVRGRSQDGILKKSRRFLSLWTRVNERRAELAPALPPLLVGQTAIEQFEGVLKGHEKLLQDIEDDRSRWNESKGGVRTLVQRLDRNNKRWYKAWLGHFPEGSSERDMLNGITIKARRNPSVPGQAVIVAADVQPDLGVRLKFDAPRGKVYELRYRGPGDTEFRTLAKDLASRIFVHTPGAPGVHAYQVISSNALGAGEPSKPWEVEWPAVRKTA